MNRQRRKDYPNLRGGRFMSDYQDRGGRNSSLIYWVIAIMLLVTGVAAPIGFLMIVL